MACSLAPRSDAASAPAIAKAHGTWLRAMRQISQGKGSVVSAFVRDTNTDQGSLIFGAFAREVFRRGLERRISLVQLSILVDVYRYDSMVVHAEAGSRQLRLLRRLNWIQLTVDPLQPERFIVQRTAQGEAIAAAPYPGRDDELSASTHDRSET